MHRCLAIQEIVREIVQWTAAGLADRERGSLVQIALVSRLFYEPAMDLVWARLPGLGPLILCLPEATVKWKPGFPFSARITRCPVGSEWARFESYARRVRAVFLQGSEPPGDATLATDMASLDMIRGHFPRPIFPRLRYLKFTKEFCHVTESFMHDHLECVTMYGVHSDLDFVTLVQWVETRAPHLRMLHMMHGNLFDAGHEQPSIHLSKSVCALDRLESLDGWYHPISAEALLQLSNLPRFHALALSASQAHLRTLMSPTIGRFAALTSLKLACARSTTPADWTQFLCALRAAPLTDLSVLAYTTGGPSSEIMPLLTALGCFRMLRRCELVIDAPGISAYPVWTDKYLDSSALDGLLKNEGLEHLIFERVPLSLATPLCRVFAEAWPHLQVLVLAPVQDFDAHPEARAPLHDLMHFARCCPRLHSLTVECTSPLGDWSWQDPGPTVPPSDVRMLDLLTTELEPAADGFAAFRTRFFPDADLVYYQLEDED